MKKTYTETFKYGKVMRDRMYELAHKCDYKPYKLVYETSFIRGNEEPYTLTYSFAKR